MKKHLIRTTTVALAVMLLASSAVLAATSKSPFSKSGYSSYQVAASNNGKTIFNGVDVSVFQSRKGKDAVSNLNWGTVKKAGVDYAILRVGGTYAVSLEYYIDDTYKDHYTKARKAGLMTGAYWLSQATSSKMAIAEADKCVALLQKYGVKPENMEFPVYMDYEFVSGGKMSSKNLTRAKATEAAKAFTERIASYGYTPGIYASTSFYDKYIDAGQLSPDCRFWIAQYWDRCEYSNRSYDMWQYSSSGQLSGMFIDSNNKVIDCNFWYVDKNAGSLSKCNVACDRYVSYSKDGALHKPAVIVRAADGTKLKAGTDYTLSYLKNTRKGTGYIYVRGIGRYTGHQLAKFTIESNIADRYDMSECRDIISWSNGWDSYISKDNLYLTGLPEGARIEDVLASIELPEYYTAEIRDAAGNKLTEGNLGTGQNLYIYNDGLLAGIARVLIDGDINGDGYVTEADLDYVAESIVRTRSLNAAQKLATGAGTAGLKALMSEARKLDDKEPLEFTGEYPDKLVLSTKSPRLGQYITADISCLSATARPYALLLTVSSGSRVKVNKITDGRAVYNSGKLLIYGDYSEDPYCQLRMQAVKTGSQKVSFKGSRIDRDGSVVSYSHSATVKTAKASAPAIGSVAPDAGSLAVSWKNSKNMPFTGYQVRYSTKSSMSGAKTVKLASADALSTELTGLGKGKKYYVQVRGYISSTSYASSWSTKKSMTTKS